MPAWLSRIDGRWFVGAILLGWVAIVFCGSSEPRWGNVGVIGETPSYVDLYVFPAARAAQAFGADPYATSEYDPHGRPYNYPMVWLAFMRFGADPQEIGWVAAGMALAAAGSLLLFVGRLSAGRGLLFGLCAVSPAVTLGFERGNTDLVIFALMALAAWAWRRSEGGAAPTVLIALAAILKLYPLLGLSACLGRVRRRLQAALVGLGVVAGWMIARHAELTHILRNTGSGWVLSYGSRTFAKMAVQVALYTRNLAWDEGRLARVGLLWAVVVVAIAIRHGLRSEAKPLRLDPAHRAGFRIGAAIYVATFVMGSSFDYRLIFLLLTLPAMVSWAAAGMQGARLCLASTVVLLWVNFAFERWIGFAAKELASWIVLAGLSAGLAADIRASLRSSEAESASSLAEPAAQG